MSSNWITWLLAGALAASLTWNFQQRRPERESADYGDCSESCSLAVGDLDLMPAQQRELEQLGAASCGRSSELEVRAAATARELYALLAEPQADEARIRELAAEVGRLRAESLSECVATILAVRKVLGPEQLEALLERCQR